MSPAEIRALLAEGPKTDTGNALVECRVCGHQVSKQGYGPHTTKHRRQIGDLDKKPKRKKAPHKLADPTEGPLKAEPKRSNPVENPPLAETLTGVLYAYVGDTVPTSMLAEISEWVAHSESLFAALTKEVS